MIMRLRSMLNPARFDSLEPLLAHAVYEAEGANAYSVATKVKLSAGSAMF